MSPKAKPNTPGASSRGFDADLEAVTAAGDLPVAEAAPLLQRFLTHRNNLIVARAAKAAGRHNLIALSDQLANAFNRFMPGAGDPPKTDPQCWAKNELARTLAAFQYQNADLFLSGLHHIQLEPVWAGKADTAGALRGTCALALVQCRDLPSHDVLRYLTPLFTDKEQPVRVDAARAVEQIGTEAAALLLRLRAELGSDETDVLGACIGGVLRLEGTSALPWAAAFLRAEDDLAAETAFLLAEHRSPQAVAHLTLAFQGATSRDFRTTIITALAAARLPEAYRFLLELVTQQGLFAAPAREALTKADPPEDITSALLRV